MSARNAIKTLSVLSVLAICIAATPAAKSDESKSKLPLSLDEMKSQRKAVREELMLPSLAGIHSLAYRVLGYKNYEPLDKLFASKLAQLDIPLTAVIKMKNDSHCDAIVQISFFKAGINTIAELKVTQWVSLLRNPKIQVRAVTYSDKTYFMGDKVDQAIEQLSSQFVVDFLKANQKNFDAEKYSKTAPGASKNSSAKTKN